MTSRERDKPHIMPVIGYSDREFFQWRYNVKGNKKLTPEFRAAFRKWVEGLDWSGFEPPEVERDIKRTG